MRQCLRCGMTVFPHSPFHDQPSHPCYSSTGGRGECGPICEVDHWHRARERRQFIAVLERLTGPPPQLLASLDFGSGKLEIRSGAVPTFDKLLQSHGIVELFPKVKCGDSISINSFSLIDEDA